MRAPSSLGGASRRSPHRALRRALHRTARGARPRLAIALVLAAALAAGCAGDAPRGTTVLAKVPERIVLLPLNVTNAMPAELRDHAPEVWSALESYLRAQGSQLKTVSAPAARGLWAASVRDAQVAQQNSQRRLDHAVGYHFVAKLRESADFDAVIFPSLFVQRATLTGTRASWDGVERKLEVDAGPHAGPVPDDAPIEGIAPAASLHVVVFDSAGNQVHEKQAGLALLVRARAKHLDDPDGPKLSFVPRGDPFADPDALRDGVAKALDPFLTSPDHTPAPPHKPRQRHRPLE
jgi:hypothetical protein